jgi:hypothetical protein
MAELKIKAPALEEKNVIIEEKLLEAQAPIDAAIEEASFARDFLRDKDAADATEMTEDTEKTLSKMNKYCATKLFQHLN